MATPREQHIEAVRLADLQLMELQVSIDHARAQYVEIVGSLQRALGDSANINASDAMAAHPGIDEQLKDVRHSAAMVREFLARYEAAI